ncbi:MULTISPECIES: hypothetical protein [unclassified Nitratiruptor]|uniref:hypothetical protein n=1 Tax=unclassified Nitratiruptor TaxID=2624044 RepID=UPI0019163E09|nr:MULTISPECIES: hypothetical protein [unclassified Nitratiruptor]BCD59925.1 hypothetical protein NitYY0810_C0684 [Nitratiruptor sp. YY08-10]BCD63848.1 hypothetical protein NitYY0814_C0683 [Nitratiruptor sp. YY08-14]
MKLDIDDFSILLNDQEEGTQQNQQKDPEDIERQYQEKLLQLEKEYKNLIEKASKDSYEKGFQEATKLYEQKMQENLSKLKKEFEEQYKQKQQLDAKNVAHMTEELKKAYEITIEKFSTQINEYITSILEYLYIDPNNSQYVVEKIEEILEQFHNYFPISIEISSRLKDLLQNKIASGVEIKVNEHMKENEFVIHFHDFLIQPDLKKKLELIKDELSQEIENSSKISD